MILKDAILAQEQPAVNHMTASGLQKVADHKTLQGFMDGITEDIPLTIDHSQSLMSKLGSIGKVIQSTVKIVGKQLKGDLEIADAAFTDAMNKIGNFIVDTFEKDKSAVNVSLESTTSNEEDPANGVAYIRPIKTTAASLVSKGALTDELFQRYSAGVINNNTEENIMSKNEVKKIDEVKPLVTVGDAEPVIVTKLEAAPEVAAPVETKLEAASAPEPVPTPQELMAAIKAMHNDFCAFKQKYDDAEDVDGDDEELKASAKPEEKKEEKKAIVVKFSEDIKVNANKSEFSAEELIQKGSEDSKFFRQHKNEIFSAMDAQRKKVKASMR